MIGSNMINGSVQKIRHWLRKEPARIETARTWLPFWVGLLAILFGQLLQPGGMLFPKEDATWAAMQASGRWRIGVDPSFPPFEFLDETGQPIGFDLAMADQIADDWGMEVEIVPMGFDSLVDAVQSGQIDSVVSALPYDPRLTQDLRYSAAYFDAGILVAVAQESSLADEAKTTFLTVEDAPQFLSERRVAVEWGGLGDMIGRRYQREGSDIELVPFPTPEEAVNSLLNDSSIDAVLIDNVTLHQVSGSGAIIGVGPILESNPYVIALPIDGTVLNAAVDDSLTALRESGQLDQLAEEWFSID